MPDLQSCYFCGTPENVQEYAVVPPRFTADGESPQSAVLCDQCKTKLLQVIEPLTEQLDGAAASHELSASESPMGTSESSTPPEPDDSGVTISAGEDTAGGESGRSSDGTSGDETNAGAPVDTEAAGSRPDGDSAPPNYRRAMRMLSNREFPLDRSEVESMLGGAYDLERHEIASVLDHAIETGRLHEEDGEFHQS